MDIENKDENIIKTIKYCNNLEYEDNDKVEKLELCMERAIDLSVFELFINLKELYLIKNNITDITPLFKCTNLVILYLQINKIKSIIGIEQLTQLEKLNLFQNELNEQFIHINKNKNLQYIDLSDNKIENIEFFNNTTSFISINLANNQISNIDALKDNEYLEHLDISGNKIGKYDDIQVLHKLKNLKSLYLSSIYYGDNILTNGILYKHYFFSNFPNLQVLDHEIINDKFRKMAISDLEVLKNIIDLKIHYIQEKYRKEKYYILFINNKNISYLNDVLKPLNFYFNIENTICGEERQKKEKMKREVEIITSAYTNRFNYIIKMMKEERDLQIKYIATTMNSYLNVYFQYIRKEEEEFIKIEKLIKANFHTESFKSYSIEDIKVENVMKVKKLTHSILDNTIENHLQSVIYKKNLLFLHPYHYSKINSHFGFIEKDPGQDDDKGKLFEKNFVCSSINMDHIIKTLIRIFLEKDEKDQLVHLAYYKTKNEEDYSNIENDIHMRKKIVKTKKFDFPVFKIYILENYMFPNEGKEVYAYSTHEIKQTESNEGREKKDSIMEGTDVQNNFTNKFKIYYTAPKHTNLKYIVDVILSNQRKDPEEEIAMDKKGMIETKKSIENKESTDKKEEPCEVLGKNKEALSEKKGNFLSRSKSKDKSTDKVEIQRMNSTSKEEKEETKVESIITYIHDKNKTFFKNHIKEDPFNYILGFENVSFYTVTKYFIKLSKIICVIKKMVANIFTKYNIKYVDFIHKSTGTFKINMEENLKEIEEKKKMLSSYFFIQEENETYQEKYKQENEETNFNNTKDHQSSMWMLHMSNHNKHVLYLNSMNINKINVTILPNYNNLKELYLRNNNINNLNYFFQFGEMDLENLEVLDLACNNIVDLTPLYNKMKQLTHVNLSFNYLHDYNQIVKFSEVHKNIEFLSILNNSIYIKEEYYANVHFLFPKIRIFNNIEIENKNPFSINEHSFIPLYEESYFDEYLFYNNLLENKMKRNKSVSELLANQESMKLCKQINSTNYHSFIKIINISNMHSSLQFLDFSSFENLKILNLSNNGIKGADDLKLPTKLKVLDLKDNKISSLHFLNDQLELEKIILDNNELRSIDKTQMLHKLKILRASYNKINNIPIFSNVYLTELSIHNNLIKDITHLILMKNKNSLIAINIYNNKINFVNLELYLIHIFPNLIMLNNKYVQRTANIDKIFKNIYTPDVFFNRYNLYPPYTSLVKLDLNNLKIKKIFLNINNEHFKNLKTLDLSNNYISNIHNIGPLDNLKTLIMHNNKHITEASFTNQDNKNQLNAFKSLEELDISNCLLSKTTFFKKCTNLKNLTTLNLEGNHLHTVKYLEHFHKLQTINLANNKIAKVFPETFPTNLKNLNLSNNLIRNLNPFAEMKNIEVLDIRVNRIENIDEFKHLQTLTSLKTLYISGNRKIKENFGIVKSFLAQIESFDIKESDIQQNNLTNPYVRDKKEELNKNVKEVKPTLLPLDTMKMKTPTSNDKAKLAQLKGIVKKKNSFEHALKIKKEGFTVIGKKAGNS